jgi:hypothetical protein
MLNEIQHINADIDNIVAAEMENFDSELEALLSDSALALV